MSFKVKVQNIIMLLLSLVFLNMSSCNHTLIKEKDKSSPAVYTEPGGGKEMVQKELPPIEYARWVQDENNGLKISQQQGQYVYELQYQPLEYLVVLQDRPEQISGAVLKSEVEKRGDLQYFTFKMSTVKGKGILSDKSIEIKNKETYMLSGMQNDFMLLNGEDTLKCVMYYFEGSNNLIPYDQCVLAFEAAADPHKDIIFLYRTDKYTDGWVKMNIRREKINSIPKLKTI